MHRGRDQIAASIPPSPILIGSYDFLNVLNVIITLFFFMDCAVSEFAFSELVSPASAGWLAIKAFFTATRLVINDFFWIDILFSLS
jgi:hypothetical protein